MLDRKHGVPQQNLSSSLGRNEGAEAARSLEGMETNARDRPGDCGPICGRGGLVRFRCVLSVEPLPPRAPCIHRVPRFGRYHDGCGRHVVRQQYGQSVRVGLEGKPLQGRDGPCVGGGRRGHGRGNRRCRNRNGHLYAENGERLSGTCHSHRDGHRWRWANPGRAPPQGGIARASLPVAPVSKGRTAGAFIDRGPEERGIVRRPTTFRRACGSRTASPAGTLPRRTPWECFRG
jgi:hypothetical protein